MSGTVAMACTEIRWTAFSICLAQLKHPPNTRQDWVISTDIPGARNNLVQRSLEMGSEWVLFLDSDQLFNSDLLLRLLSHEKDIVSALYVRRAGDHSPLAFSHRDPDTKLYAPIDLTELPGEGLLKVRATGAGGLLIRSEVFRAIDSEPTWFEHGRVHGEDWNAAEDIIFCEKARRAGFDVYVDLGCQMGHIAPSAVWPTHIDQEWCLGFSVSDSTRLYVPIEKAAEVQDAAPADAVRR